MNVQQEPIFCLAAVPHREKVAQVEKDLNRILIECGAGRFIFRSAIFSQENYSILDCGSKVWPLTLDGALKVSALYWVYAV